MYDIYILSHNTVIITKLLLIDSCGKVRGEVHKNAQRDMRSSDSQKEGRRESPCSKQARNAFRVRFLNGRKASLWQKRPN
jgi:hypothetical protein